MSEENKSQEINAEELPRLSDIQAFPINGHEIRSAMFDAHRKQALKRILGDNEVSMMYPNITSAVLDFPEHATQGTTGFGRLDRECDYVATPVRRAELEILLNRKCELSEGVIPEIKGVHLKDSLTPKKFDIEIHRHREGASDLIYNFDTPFAFLRNPRVAGIDFTSSPKKKKRRIRQIEKRIRASGGPKKLLFKLMLKDKTLMSKKIRNSTMFGRPGNTSKAMHAKLDRFERDVCLRGYMAVATEVTAIRYNHRFSAEDANVALNERFNPDFNKG